LSVDDIHATGNPEPIEQAKTQEGQARERDQDFSGDPVIVILDQDGVNSLICLHFIIFHSSAFGGFSINLDDTSHNQGKHQQPHINPAFEILEALNVVITIVSQEIIKERHKEEGIVEERKSPDLQETGSLDAKEPTSIIKPEPDNSFH